jgi:hypothetical protein
MYPSTTIPTSPPDWSLVSRRADDPGQRWIDGCMVLRVTDSDTDRERASASSEPRTAHDGSVDSFARRRAQKQKGRDPEQERAKVAASARTLRVVQWSVAGGLLLGVAYVSVELWERGRVMPMLGLLAMSVIAIVRILRGTM